VRVHLRPVRLLAPAAAVALALALTGNRTPAQSDGEFEPAIRAARELPRLHSLVASAGGDVLVNYHARGIRPTQPANIKSAAKSVISALAGIAIDRGLIKSVGEPIADFFPELRKDPDPRKARITIEDLLTMRSGLESTSGRDYGRWVTSANRVTYALRRPMVADPGTTMQYSTGSSHLLSAILTKVSKTSTWQFADQALGPALGAPLARWTRDPQGIYFGGNEMLMTPRQMLAFGELYLRRGRAGDRQIVPAAWVDMSCVPRTISRWDAGREYGYGWWIDGLGSHDSCFAWGYGGQYIFVVRDLDLVIAVTSSTTTSDERHGYRRALFDLLEEHVLPVVEARNGHQGAAIQAQANAGEVATRPAVRRESSSPRPRAPGSLPPIAVLLAAAAACASALIASIVITWASNRSALSNMVLAALRALAVFAGLVIAAMLLARAAFPD
jgi:CubicO group peptidase (beta-lactamase class C family)